MQDNRFTTRVFALAAVGLLAYLLYRIFHPFLGPIVWALLLAFLLFPANRKLRAALKGRNGAAALLLTFAVMFGIVAPVVFLGFLFVRQASDLLARVSAAAGRYQIERPQDLFKIPFLDRAVQWIDRSTLVTADQVREWLIGASRSFLELALAQGRQVLLGALGAVVALLLMLFILYFFFRDGDAMAGRLLSILPMRAERKASLAAHLSDVTKAVVFGTLLTALIQGALVGIAFAVTGLPSPVVFGFLAAIASLLPVAGTALVWLPGAVVLFARGSTGWAIFLAVWGALVVGSADNVLRPLLISGRAQISTLPVFFGVLGGIAAFGPIGIFAGPLVIALALALVRFAEEGSSESGPA